MQARSALFDVYGDHLRSRGSEAPVAAVVRLLDPVGITAPAVRTAISRMVMQGWLEPVSSTADAATGPPHAPTVASTRPAPGSTAGARRRGTAPGSWSSCDRRSAAPAGPGCGPTWPSSAMPSSPRTCGSVRSPAASSRRSWSVGARPRAPPAQTASTTHRPVRGTSRPAYGVRRLADLRRRPGRSAPRRPRDPDEADFAARFHLVHEWRKFLFADPGLPDVLLPDDWPGGAAADLFSAEAERLKPGADRFVARCLDSRAGLRTV